MTNNKSDLIVVQKEGEIRLDCKIPSLNSTYKCMCRGGKAVMYKSSEVKLFQQELTLKLGLSEVKHLSKLPAKEVEQVYMSINLKLKENLYKRDVSNSLKMIEDCISNVTGINDNRNTKVIISKSLSVDNHEYIGINIFALLRESRMKKLAKKHLSLMGFASELTDQYVFMLMTLDVGDSIETKLYKILKISPVRFEIKMKNSSVDTVAGKIIDVKSNFAILTGGELE